MEVFYHFTDIHGGVSEYPYKSLNLALHVKDNPLHVRKNRQIIQSKLDLPNLVFMNQIHSNIVNIVNDTNIEPTCDGLITNVPNLALCVLVADCIPLLLYDKTLHVVSAIHAGRAGVFSEIAKESVQKMSENFGTKAQNIKAYIGPSIKQCCYEIDGEVLEFSKQKYPLHVKQNCLDIRGILLSQLRGLGIKDIEDKSTCTSCDRDFFSYRRDGVCGRQAGIIMLKDKS